MCVKDGFLFVKFCEGQAADNTTRAQDTIRQASTNTDQEILHNVRQEVEYRFDVARATRGAHTELY
jgi:uncharacterized membrane protein